MQNLVVKSSNLVLYAGWQIKRYLEMLDEEIVSTKLSFRDEFA